MWLEDPDKRHMAEGKDDETLFLKPEEIAMGMLELCENPEYGDGTILEVSKGKRKVVPLYHSEPPEGAGVVVPKFLEEAKKLWNELENGGLKV